MNIFARFSKPMTLPTADDALPGRAEPLQTAERHAVNGEPLQGHWPGMETAVFAMGCFWGAERLFWMMDGVTVTAVGYIGGVTANPNYREVCSGKTGHTEGVLVVYDPEKVTFEKLVSKFFEGHDPTQGMRQGNDVGTQYRSAIFVNGEDRQAVAEKIKAAFEAKLKAAGHGEITTTIHAAQTFYYAEAEHQQYLHKVPNGYCGLGGTGVSCPVGLGAAA
ncbi:peptide-methionine (S)-S-oxide reductase MsrA [Acuticoccus sp. MNP-M23]|uniref:peptide-methionine (S)-S-oxide reductase MsrA n=1 Tax=Acuticoccus sp. MNP-M23 TaxID=3072793 RepID=UPI0028166B17|nr:peptide-methionine (S)-S-oxide reductase MsrA [Acuticoccus sp. MNP-M23]WMS44068.1 peptide-methionine (S)-S-oxide reductase MsrA [Acuticoccus sp. MNP-M23]